MQESGQTIDKADSAAHTFLILSRATKAMSDLIETHLKQFDLSDTDFRILELLMSKGPLPVNTIGPKVWLTSGSVSTAIDRLLARSLVRREECRRDRRIRTVSLTEAGNRLIAAAFQRNAGVLEQIMSPLTKSQRSQLEAMMKVLGHRAEDLNRPGD